MQLGAFVNETFQAREGLEPALFPAVPSYLGHYHKPHTVRNTTIRYTGSPYQGMHPTRLPPRRLSCFAKDSQNPHRSSRAISKVHALILGYSAGAQSTLCRFSYRHA